MEEAVEGTARETVGPVKTEEETVGGERGREQGRDS